MKRRRQTPPKPHKDNATFDEAEAGVCPYVADAFNRNAGKDILLSLEQAVDIRNDGHPASVRLQYLGSIREASLAIGGRNDGADEEVIDPPELLDQLGVVQFGGRNFIISILDGGPVEVSEYGQGSICQFSWQWTSDQTETSDEPECRKAAASEQFPEIPVVGGTEPPIPPGAFGIQGARRQAIEIEGIDRRPSALDLFEPDNAVATGRQLEAPLIGSAWLSQAALIAIDAKRDAEPIGRLVAQLPGGRGCTIELLTLLDKDGIDQSPRNIALLNAQKFEEYECQRRSFPVSIAGRTFVEVDHDRKYGQVVPDRVLLEIGAKDVHPLCRTHQKARFVPAYEAMPSNPDAAQMPMKG